MKTVVQTITLLAGNGIFPSTCRYNFSGVEDGIGKN